jgi:phosphotransacetylase
MKFPEPDPSIPMNTTKLTTIGGNYGDSDPLAQIPMSRVSKEAKQKMAEIAKEDISKRLEETNKSIFPESVEYTDEYYKSTLPKKVKEKMLKAVPSENDQRLGVELVKPKRKTTNKNKK